jgi:menaquinone-dependent protoporphyrinogen IX oxidase
MKTLVVYYSKEGSNLFLAERIAKRLNADIEEIRPRVNSFPLFLMGIHFGIKPLKHRVADYDRIILCGPIWVGRFIGPLRGFVNRYRGQIRQLVFVTCCGSSYSKKEEKFGHGLVFKKVESILGDKCALCQAFPVGLVLPEEQREDPDAFQKAHLTNESFHGEIEEIFEDFMAKIDGKKEGAVIAFDQAS